MTVESRVESLAVLLVGSDLEEAALIWSRLKPTFGNHIGAVNFVQAESIAGARSVLHSTAIDVVILDLSLPDSAGLQALRQIRSAAPGLPVVVLAERADESLALDALRAGAQDYLLKPAPEGVALWRILSYARERQHLMQDLGVALNQSGSVARRWRVLAEVCKVAGLPDEPQVMMATLGKVIVPDAADCFIVCLAGDDEVSGVMEVAHADRSLIDGLRGRVSELLSGTDAENRLSALGHARELNTGGPHDGASPVLAFLRLQSGMVVPLFVGGRVRGFVALSFRRNVPSASQDMEFGKSVADRVSTALQHARLYHRTQRALAARDRAVGIVSHDLRNPLSTIQICATALLDPDPPHVKGMRNMAQIIQRSAAWMEQIVQDLLDRTSLDAGRLSLERVPTAVSDVVAAAQVMFAPVAEERSLSFVVQNASDLPPVDADPRRLLQVLSNLLNNAMKFTPADGRVVLSAALDAGESPDSARASRRLPAVRFAVTDNGPGISGEDLAHVFDWFWHSPRGGSQGSGLGLAIAQGLVEAHGSRLRVESAPGRGSSFWFTIPAAAEASDSFSTVLYS